MDAPRWRAGPGQGLLDLRADDVLARLRDDGAVHLRGFARVPGDFEPFTERFGA